MALDLTNGYSRKDGASASNLYFGYSVDANVADSDKVFAIRRVTSVGGVETVQWANGNQLSYSSNWSGRTYSFSAPGGNLNISSTTSTTLVNSIPTHRIASFTWSALNGVSKYLISALDTSGKLIQKDGFPITGQYVNRSYSTELLNLTSYTQQYLNPGTYTFTVRAENVAGFTSSSVTINFPI